MNIHDRVNLAAERSVIYVDEGESGEVVLNIVIDTEKCPVMDYFEIYFRTHATLPPRGGFSR